MNTKISISLFVLLGLITGINENSCAQSCYSPVVDSIVSRVTIESIRKTVRELTGDTSCIVVGKRDTILTRAYNFPGNELAAMYIYNKFVSYGLNAAYQPFSSTGKNVIGTKTGTKYPHRFFVLCAHYDSYPWEARSPGADDNASGTAAVLEAAKLLMNYQTEYTIKFIGFDEEERMYYGSLAYADSCERDGDTLVGVMNMDMLGWDANNLNRVAIYTDINSRSLADIVYASIQLYVPDINSSIKDGYVSDDVVFQDRGYKAICPWEDPYNPFVNSLADSIGRFNFPYYQKMVRCVVAGISTLGFDYVINFSHQPIATGNDTAEKVAVVTVNSNHSLAAGNDACRLYYRVNGSAYMPLDYSYRNLDTFKFAIPGQGYGSTVSYYFTSQDLPGTLFTTYPGGGKSGVPPISPITYYVTQLSTFCSSSLPQTITPLHFVIDSIRIPQNYSLLDLDISVTVNHPVDKSVYINLTNPQGNTIVLSYAHGDSSANYLNTVFDDEAADSIKNGVPPFTGHFIPDSPLNVCDNKSMAGLWKLKVVNGSPNLTGELVSWCMHANFVYPIGIIPNQTPVAFYLLQNYPNPFNPVTMIKYSIPVRNMVKMVVYDVTGREVKILANEMKEAGTYSVIFDGSEFASGVYFYRIEAGEFTEVKKMVLIK